MSTLKEWFRINGLFKSQQGTEQKTHYLLDRGVLFIPEHKIDAFYKKYAQCLENGHKVYVIELRRPVFPMFCDWDFFNVLGTDMSKDYIKSVMKIIQHVIYEHYPYKTEFERNANINKKILSLFFSVSLLNTD